jgi:hypothetical protein
MGQKRCYFQKRTGEVVESKGSSQKTNRNEPKNEAEKLLKTRSCGKNEPKTKLPMLLIIKEREKTNLKRTGEYGPLRLAFLPHF